MRRYRLVVLTVALIASAFALTAAPSVASPSSDLASVLARIRGMLSIDTGHLVEWAKNGTPAPENPVFDLEKTEAAILDLDSEDRYAVLRWLRGDGRSALHDRGASDSDIGPPHAGIESKSAVAPPDNPWRSIPLVTNSIDQHAPSQLQILGGFAAVKKDGKGAIVCVSFKNLDTRVARHVVIEFPILGDGGQITGTLVLDRFGEFAPNVDINSFSSLQAWQSGFGPRGQNDGCIGSTLGTAALPFLQAQAVGYTIKTVEYDTPR